MRRKRKLWFIIFLSMLFIPQIRIFASTSSDLPGLETKPIRTLRTNDYYDDIQTAISEAEEGETVFIGPGVFRIDKGLIISDKASFNLEGSGMDETKIYLTYPYDTVLTITDSTDISISRLSVSHESSEEECLAGVISVTKSSNITIRGNEIAGTGSKGIELSLVSGIIDISNNFIHNNRWAGIDIPFISKGLDMLIIKRNIIEDNGECGINSSAGYMDDTYGFWEDVDVIAEKNVFNNNGRNICFFHPKIARVIRKSMVSSTYPADAGIENATAGFVYADIQTAINEAVEGETIKIGPGKYSLPHSIYINHKNSLTIIGAGKDKTRIIVPVWGEPGGNMCVFHISNSSNIYIRGLSIEFLPPSPQYARISNDIAVILVNNVANIEFAENEIFGSVGSGMKLFDVRGTVKINGNVIRNNHEYGIALTEQLMGIEMISMNNNIIRDNDGYGIGCIAEKPCRLSPDIIVEAKRNVFSGNVTGDFFGLSSEIIEIFYDSPK